MDADLIVWRIHPMFQSDIEPFSCMMATGQENQHGVGHRIPIPGFQALKRQVDHCTTTALWPMVLKPKDSIK